MNSGVRFIICMISSVVWERTESICGGIVGRGTESLLCALSGTGKGVDAGAAVTKGGCESGFEDASEGERFKEEDSLSESSSMRAMVIDYGGLKKVEVPRPNVVGLSDFGNKLSTCSTSTLIIAQIFIVFNPRGIKKDSRLCTDFFIFCFFCIDVSPDLSLISVDHQSTHCHFR